MSSIPNTRILGGEKRVAHLAWPGDLARGSDRKYRKLGESGVLGLDEGC